MAVSTSGGVDCRLSYRRMVDILNTSSTSCRHLYSITLLFVAYVITDELFGGVYNMIFSSYLYAAVMLIVCGAIYRAKC